MSTSGVRKLHDHGPSSWAVTEPVRRTVEQSDIRYAHACRAKGWGWQAIARQVGINETTLRRACGDVVAEPVTGGGAGLAPSGDAARLAPSGSSGATSPVNGGGMVTRDAVLRPGSVQARGLVAIGAGARDYHELGRALGNSPEGAKRCAATLRLKGLVTTDWRLTASGLRVRAVVARETDPPPQGVIPLKPGGQTAMLVLAVAAGAASLSEVSAKVTGSVNSLKVVASQLRARGLLGEGWTLTRDGRATAEWLQERMGA